MITDIRKQMTIHPDVMDLLNDQIALEMKASASYLAMASWCDQRELVNSKAFFYNAIVNTKYWAYLYCSLLA